VAIVKAAIVPVAKAGNAKDPFNKNKQSEKPKTAVVSPSVASAKVATGTTVAVSEAKAPADEKKPETKKLSAASQRDPFVSPVVRLGSTGSGCSSGKRCLAIDQIALKGVVRSETGMIAVVVNSMSKAYFLRENDPVFNGYVTKITPDSIVFKETFHDKVGKPLTRDVTKTINRPAA
jgi:Tfp pilus assembly protein PilP